MEGEPPPLPHSRAAPLSPFAGRYCCPHHSWGGPLSPFDSFAYAAPIRRDLAPIGNKWGGEEGGRASTHGWVAAGSAGRRLDACPALDLAGPAPRT